MEAGYKIDERYVIKQILSNETFIVENILSGARWILKALPYVKDRHLIEILLKIRHPALPRIFEYLEIEGKPYYIMEYIDGEPLSDIITRNHGKIPYLEACLYMSKVARICYFLHTQIGEPLLHLDIKPSNILITPGNIPCLIDYGSMCLFASEHEGDKSVQHERICTLAYAPPEMINGGDVNIQSDIYMMGITLYRMITGKEHEYALDIDFRTDLHTIPASVSRIIIKCTMTNPRDRYSNAGELAADLENCCETSLNHNTYPFAEYNPVAIEEDRRDFIYQRDLSTIKGKGHPVNESIKSKGEQSKKILCVWDNASFAAEIGCVLAKHGKNVLLIDVNLLSPEIDLLVDLKHEKTDKLSSSSGNCLSDLMEEHAKNRLTPDTIKIFANKSKTDYLSCICGNYRMEDYDYYSTEGVVNIIKTATGIYDHIIISCGKFIYDEFTCVSLICSDIILIPIIANSIYFREFNRYIHFMSGRKQLNPNKLFYVGFDYQSGEDFSYGICDELCDGKFIGSISYSQRRRMMHGSSKSYISVMESKIEKQYLHLLRKLKILVSN